MKANSSKQHLVMMRKYREDGQVIALFVEEPASIDSPHSCQSYMALGQHSSANPYSVMQNTRRAAPGEYKDLFDELERIGYGQNVKVVDRMTRKMQQTREANWRRMVDPKAQPRYKLEALLREYVESGETNLQGGIRDVLTDLRHIADRENLDFDFAVDGSAAVQEEEQEDGSLDKVLA